MPRWRRACVTQAENPYPDDPVLERAQAFAFAETAGDRFTAPVLPSGLLRLYGGMVVAQALAAAQRTVPADKPVHSLHAYFLKPGLTDRPPDFAVRRLTNGRSFAARHVSATQDANPVVEMMASFQVDEPGRDFGIDADQHALGSDHPCAGDHLGYALGSDLVHRGHTGDVEQGHVCVVSLNAL